MPENPQQKLTSLLLQSDPDCVIGIGIRIYLQQPERWNELLGELRYLAAGHPDYMKEILGPEVMEMLS